MNPATVDSTPECRVGCSPTRSNAADSSARSVMSSSASSIRKSQVFQRRLKEKISESRALELLDRRIKTERVINELTLGDSNQDQDDELVCDSTMVRFEPTPEVTVESRASSVLKTVRGIHRQRERERERQPAAASYLDNRENQ